MTCPMLSHFRKCKRPLHRMSTLIKQVQQGYISKEHKQTLAAYTKVFPELSVIENLVFRGTKVIVPEKLQSQVVKLAHEGHQGIVRTKRFLRETTWFPAIDKMVESEVSRCFPCQVRVQTPQQEPLKPTNLPQEPWEKLTTDLHGPLDSGEYLLVVQDVYSRFPVVEIVSSTSPKACIPAMDRVLSSFGIPSEIGSDNGSPFNSEEYGKYGKYMGFKKTKKIPYAPWANGMVENFMKNLNKVIETANEEKRNWRQEMHKFLRAYRATPHTMTQKPPATLLFNGRKYKTRLPTPTTRTVLLYDKEVRQADNKSKALMKHRADSKGHVRTSNVQVGDRVVCKQLRRRKSTTPYSNEILVVVERKGSLVTAVGDNRTLTRHVNHFKRLASDFDIEKG